MRNGSERVVTSSREHIYDLRSLETYTFTDEGGKDQGINVRHKVSYCHSYGVGVNNFLFIYESFHTFCRLRRCFSLILGERID